MTETPLTPEASVIVPSRGGAQRLPRPAVPRNPLRTPPAASGDRPRTSTAIRRSKPLRRSAG